MISAFTATVEACVAICSYFLTHETVRQLNHHHFLAKALPENRNNLPSDNWKYIHDKIWT